MLELPTCAQIPNTQGIIPQVEPSPTLILAPDPDPNPEPDPNFISWNQLYSYSRIRSVCLSWRNRVTVLNPSPDPVPEPDPNLNPNPNPNRDGRLSADELAALLVKLPQIGDPGDKFTQA